MAEDKPAFLFLGAGYTAKAMMRQLKLAGHPASNQMVGTTRSGQNFTEIVKAGATPMVFEGEAGNKKLADLIERVDYCLISISPDEKGDIILQHFPRQVKENSKLKWLGYLSTVGVYGNYDGEWVTEESEARPGSKRSSWRKLAEDQWLALSRNNGIPVHIFRLPGIYGPGRGPMNKLRQGRARRIEKKGQVFNRAHVEDIAATLIASLKKPNPGRVYNVADDLPAPPQDVLAYAAELLQIEVPPLIPFEDAEMSSMARSFYLDNKRVSNKRMKEELGVKLKYPTYREGMKAALEEQRN